MLTATTRVSSQARILPDPDLLMLIILLNLSFHFSSPAGPVPPVYCLKFTSIIRII